MINVLLYVASEYEIDCEDAAERSILMFCSGICLRFPDLDFRKCAYGEICFDMGRLDIPEGR